MNPYFKWNVFLLAALISSALPQNPAVDFSTLEGKVLFGYQGWFGCPGKWGGDWNHWSSGTPSTNSIRVEMWPDLQEFPREELCRAGNFTIDGAPAYLFSSANAFVVDRHFKWMRDYGIDGVLVQRFVKNASGMRRGGDKVLRNVLAAAKKYGRAVAVEYDVAGSSFSSWDDLIKTDWQYLVNEIGITSVPNYLHHKGKPLVSVWGMGLSDGNRHPPAHPEEALALVKWFHGGAGEKYRASVMGGVPAGFRPLGRDARPDSGWHEVYRAMDAVQPWNVGRFSALDEVNGWWKSSIGKDRQWLADAGVLYMPVIFPGFSWSKWKEGEPNKIPRLGGRFIWQQAMVAKQVGAGAIKIAMFDEVDEGTAMFKIAPTAKQAPEQTWWLTLDADGESLPSDWYLRLGGEITKVMRGTTKPQQEIPIRPEDDYALTGTKFFHQSLSGAQITRTSTGIRIAAPGARVVIWDTAGKRIRALPLNQGMVEWDTNDGQGVRVRPGVFQVGVENSQGERTANFPVVISP